MQKIMLLIKKLFMQFGMYIPLVIVIIITFSDIRVGDAQDWNKYLLENLLTIGLGYQMLFFGIFHIFFGGDCLCRWQ